MRSKEIINGNYVVYEDGRVWSNKRNKYLSHTRTSRNGRYLCVGLMVNGKQKHQYIHRLLAECFIPNPENKLEVNHLDGNPRNYSLDNLEWVTRSENCQHAYATGLMDKNLKTKECKCGEMVHPRIEMCKRCRDARKRQKAKMVLVDKRNREADALESRCRNRKDVEFLKLWRNGTTYAEIGEKLGCTKQAVEQRYRTIKGKNPLMATKGIKYLMENPSIKVLYPNLAAEAARAGYTSRTLANALNISEAGMRLKMNGKSDFKVSECKQLTKLFGCSFEYLFSHEQISYVQEG